MQLERGTTKVKKAYYLICRMPPLQTGMRDQLISIVCGCGWTFVTVRIRATCNTRGGGRHAALLCSTHPRGAHTLPLPTPQCDYQPRVGCFVRMPKKMSGAARAISQYTRSKTSTVKRSLDSFNDFDHKRPPRGNHPSPL